MLPAAETAEACNSYLQIAAEHRRRAMAENLPNVRGIFMRSAERWQMLADSMATRAPGSQGQAGDRAIAHSPARRACAADPSQRVRVGPLEVDRTSEVATVDEIPIPLTDTEFVILDRLASSAGNPVSREAMLRHLYGARARPDDKVLEVFVCNLRKKLANAGRRGFIRTVRGYGYVLTEAADGPQRMDTVESAPALRAS